MKFPRLRLFIFVAVSAVLAMVPSQTFAHLLERTLLPTQGLPEQVTLLIFGALLVVSGTYIKRNLL